jgi:hypothetical protein
MTMPHLRLAGGIAATLAILALVSSSFYLYGNSRVAGPSLQALASAAKSTTPAAPSSHPSTAPLVGDWHIVDTQLVDDQFMPTHVVALSRGGFAAFVHDSTVDETVVYGSSDGTTWTNVGALPTKHATVDAVADSGGQVVAVGFSSDNATTTAFPMAWASSDLKTWHATALPAPTNTGVDIVAAGPGGFLASGHVMSLNTPTSSLWASTNGTTWRAVAGAGLPDAWIWDLSANSGGYVEMTNMQGQIQTWRSVDGAVWTRVWSSPADSTLSDGLSSPAVKSPNGSYIRLGTGVVWTSDDLVSWAPAGPITVEGTEVGTFVSIPGGFLGSSPCEHNDSGTPICVDTSLDGRTWVQAFRVPTRPGSADFSGAVTVVSDGIHAIVVLKDYHDKLHFLVGTELG